MAPKKPKSAKTNNSSEKSSPIISNEPIYSGLSAKAQHLLDKDEGFDVDFKADMNGLDSESIVAFANSVSGGAILIGVAEHRNERGEQRGQVVGCSISDRNRLTINNKAGQCIPPVSITIHVENNNSIPFYRVEIPSSINKPHCTSGGTYKIRKDNQKRSLSPTELLQLFLEQEGNDFIKRFKEATKELSANIFKQNQELVEFISNSTLDLEINTQSMIDNLNQEIGDTVQDIKSQTESLEQQTESFIETLQQETTEIKEQLEFGELRKILSDLDYKITRSAWKANRILEHLGLEDPEIEFERNQIKGYLRVMKKISEKKSLELDSDFLQEMYMRSNRVIKDNYKVEELKNWYDELDLSDE